MDPQAPLIGATIGNYRVVAKLGEGGMGIVYLAEHPLIGKRVALKVLHEEHGRNPDIITRFFNEARAVNEIGHPNIVDILDYGMVQTPNGGGFVYFIMEYLVGEPLSRVLLREAPLTTERALALAAQVAEALGAAHHKGVVHRDLKPDNIHIGAGDRVKVLDFGIAKLTHMEGGSQTRTGLVLGTPSYMSPEQCEGRRDIDHRTDIYALGILLYEMITGRVPFYGQGYGDVMIQHLTKRPERPSTRRGVIPPAVEVVVMKALEKRREDRFASMEELLYAIHNPDAYVAALGGPQAFLPTPPPSATAITMTLNVGGGHPTTLTGSAGQVGARTRRSRAPLLFAGLILLVGGGIGLAMAMTRGGPPAAPVKAAQPTVPDAQPQVKTLQPEPPPPPPKAEPARTESPPPPPSKVAPPRPPAKPTSRPPPQPKKPKRPADDILTPSFE